MMPNRSTPSCLCALDKIIETAFFTIKVVCGMDLLQ